MSAPMFVIKYVTDGIGASAFDHWTVPNDDGSPKEFATVADAMTFWLTTAASSDVLIVGVVRKDIADLATEQGD